MYTSFATLLQIACAGIYIGDMTQGTPVGTSACIAHSSFFYNLATPTLLFISIL
jgi:hypothetical protein